MTVSEYVKDQVLAMYLKGAARDAIASSTGVSAGTVSSVIGGLEKQLGAELSTSLRKFCRISKKGVPPERALTGYEIAVFMHDLGADADNVRNALKTIVDLLKKGDAGSAAKVITLLSRMLQRYSNVLVEDLPQQVEKLAQDYKTLTTRNDQLRQQIVSNNNELSRTLQSNKTTLKELEQFKQVRTRLKSLDLDVNDLPRLERLLRDVKDVNYSSAKIIARCDHTESLTRRNAALERELTTKEAKSRDLDSSLQKQESEIVRNQRAYEKLAKLEEIGIGVEEMTLIQNAVEPVLRATSHDPKFVLRHALEDFRKNYSGCIYFGQRCNETRRLHNYALGQLSSIMKKISEQEEKQKQRCEAYEAESSRLESKIQDFKSEINRLGSCWRELLRFALRREVQRPIGDLHREMPYYLVNSVCRYWSDCEKQLIELTPLVLTMLDCEVSHQDLLLSYQKVSDMVMHHMSGTQEAVVIGQAAYKLQRLNMYKTASSA